MKRFLPTAAILNPGAGTLDLSSIPSFDVRRLAAVIDLKKAGAMIYGPIAGFGYSALNSGVLTLQASVSTLSASDPLLVIYDDATGKVAEDGTDITAAVMPAGGAGIRGWLSAIYKMLTGTVAVSVAALPLPAGAAQDETVGQAVTVLNNMATALGLLATDSDVQLTTAKVEAVRALLAGVIRVDPSAVTSPISAAALPLPAGAATESTLTTIKAILAAQASIAESTWFDPTVTPNTFFFRRVTNTDGVISEIWTDPTGAQVSFSANWKPISSSASFQVLPAVTYDCITAATGMSVSDVIVRIVILNLGVSPPTIAASMWLNANTGAVLSSVTMANLKEVTKDVSIPDGAFVTFGSMSDTPAANPTAGGTFMSAIRGYWTDWRARVPILGTAIMGGSSPVTLATDDKAALAIGGAGDAAAASDAGSFGLVALVKRGLGNWTTLIGILPTSRGPKSSALSFPVAIATDAGLAQDGTDMTMPSGVTAPTSGSGIRGWLSAAWVQVLTIATALGTPADAAAASSTSTTASILGWLKRFSANDDTALLAVTAATTREGALPGTLPGTMIGSGKLGVLAEIWRQILAAVGLLQNVPFSTTITATGASTYNFPLGTFGTNSFELSGNAIGTVAVVGTETSDGSLYDVPMKIRGFGAGSAAVDSLTATGAGAFNGAYFVEGAGVQGLQIQVSLTSGSLAIKGVASKLTKSMRIHAPKTDPAFVTTTPVGIGADFAMPTLGNAYGTPIGTAPAGAKGLAIFVPAGGSVAWSVQSVSTVYSSANSMPASMTKKFTNSTPLPQWIDEQFDPTAMMLFLASWTAGTDTGSPPPVPRWI